MKKEMWVWTNGNAIRKYQGQDKVMFPKDGWFKAKAIIIPVDEEEDEK